MVKDRIEIRLINIPNRYCVEQIREGVGWRSSFTSGLADALRIAEEVKAEYPNPKRVQVYGPGKLEDAKLLQRK